MGGALPLRLPATAQAAQNCHIAGRAAAGLALELASPLLPRAFLLLACLGSLARAVTGVAGGATRMALTQHFALRRNAADIAAKEGSQASGGVRAQTGDERTAGWRLKEGQRDIGRARSQPSCTHLPSTQRLPHACCPPQETAVTLIGMVLGMALIRLAAGLQPAVWAAFWALTAVHVWANVRAMRCLRVTSLNQARLGALLQHYLCTVRAGEAGREGWLVGVVAGWLGGAGGNGGGGGGGLRAGLLSGPHWVMRRAQR